MNTEAASGTRPGWLRHDWLRRGKEEGHSDEGRGAETRAEATLHEAERRGGSEGGKVCLRPELRTGSRKCGSRGHSVAQSQLPAAVSWSKGNLFETGKPGRHSEELQEFESPELGPVLPSKPSVNSYSHHPSSVMGALSWGKEGTSSALCSLWGMSCDSLMYPSKRLRNGCNVAIQLAPNPGEEEERKMQSATKAKPQKWPHLVPQEDRDTAPCGTPRPNPSLPWWENRGQRR